MTQLPREAGDFDSGPFEPNDEWLTSAPKELQIAAMRRWFLDRYEDPANETPWDGEDKAYVFVWGGPYDPNDEIQDRFGGIYPADTDFGLSIAADDLEVIGQQRAQLLGMRIAIREESVAGGLVIGKGLVVAVVQDLALEEFPEPLDQVQVRRVGR